MSRAKSRGAANIGGSSILMIFVLLSLTTFAALTLASAAAEHRLANQVRAAADLHFAAQSLAEEKLAEISRIFRTYEREDAVSLLGNLGARYEDGMVFYSVDVSESMRLDVGLWVMDGFLAVEFWRQVALFDPDEFGGGDVTLWPGR